jgi:hypothetical protein
MAIIEGHRKRLPDFFGDLFMLSLSPSSLSWPWLASESNGEASVTGARSDSDESKGDVSDASAGSLSIVAASAEREFGFRKLTTTRKSGMAGLGVGRWREDCSKMRP